MDASRGEVSRIQCNYIQGTKIASEGARAYPIMTWHGFGDGTRILLLVRSRGGRWVEKWESLKRLSNFRAKTIVPEDPLYERLKDCKDGSLAPAFQSQADACREGTL